MCAVKNSGDLDCWNTKKLVFEDILPKYKKDIKFVDNNH